MVHNNNKEFINQHIPTVRVHILENVVGCLYALLYNSFTTIRRHRFN